MNVVERAHAYLNEIPPAIAGQNGHDAAYKAALRLVQDFGLSLDQARPIMTEYSARCSPPWSDSEIEHKLNDALRNLDPHKVGCKVNVGEAPRYSDALDQWGAVRGFSRPTLLAFAVEGDEHSNVLLPERDGEGNVTGRARRRADGKPFGSGDKQLFQKGGKRGLIYSPERLGEGAAAGEALLVCEGWPDVLRLSDTGHRAVVGLPSASPGRPALRALQKLIARHGFKHAVMFPDPGERGLKLRDQVGGFVTAAGCSFSWVMPDGDQDTDDRLRREPDKAAALRELVEGALPWIDPAPARPAVEVRDPAGEVELTPDQIEELARLNRTDDGNARAVALLFGDIVRFVHVAQTWRIWNGKRWADDQTGEVERLAVRAAKARYTAAGRCGNLSDELRARLATWAIKSEGQGLVTAALGALRRQEGIATLPADWDADPLTLGLPAGAVDLRTGAYLAPDPARLISKAAGAEYQPGATCLRTDNFILEIAGGDDDLAAFLKRAIGYCLTGLTSEQAFFVLYGLGKNGKSTLLKLISWLLGDYARNADFSSFVDQKYRTGAREDLARLAGARLVTAKESNESARLDEGVIKGLTGGDVINARHLYQGSFEFVPEFKIWLACNHKPVIYGADDGIWRRVRLVPFTMQFDPGEEPNLEDTLRGELPGLLQAAVGWARDWQRERLGWPAAVKQATAVYRADSDVIGAFINDSCELDFLAETPASDLFKAYQKWAEETGERATNQRNFGLKLRERGFENKRSTGGKGVWLGIQLSEGSDP